MSIQEMMHLQGIRDDQIKNDNSEAEFGRQIGNSMSLNVVERILFAIFSTIGMLPENSIDRWRTLTTEELLGRTQSRAWRKNNSWESDFNMEPTNGLTQEELDDLSIFENPMDGETSEESGRPYREDQAHGQSNSSSQFPGTPNRFIVDSGASNHIISKKFLTKKERKTIRETNDPLCVQTANGNAESTHCGHICQRIGYSSHSLLARKLTPIAIFGETRKRSRCKVPMGQRKWSHIAKRWQDHLV